MPLKRSCGRCGRIDCPGHAVKRTRPNNPRKRGYDAEYWRNRAVMIENAWTFGWPCWKCGEKFETKEQITADHKRPLQFGGSSRLDNLAPAHKRCNSSSGARQGNLARPRK